MMRRIPDVLTAGSSPPPCPAQVHYPLRERRVVRSRTIRATSSVHRPDPRLVLHLHVLATALFDRPAFTPSCVSSHGILLQRRGQDMSPRNYLDAPMVFDRDG